MTDVLLAEPPVLVEAGLGAVVGRVEEVLARSCVTRMHGSADGLDDPLRDAWLCPDDVVRSIAARTEIWRPEAVGMLNEGDPVRAIERFRLGPLEHAILALALAVDSEPRLMRMVAFLADDARAVDLTADLALRLLVSESPARLAELHRFERDARLVHAGLLADMGPSPTPRSPLRPTPGLAAGLMRAPAGHHVAARHAHGVAIDVVRRATGVWTRTLARRGDARVALVGGSDLARLRVAEELAVAAQRPLVILDAADATNLGGTLDDAWRIRRRDAALAGAVLYSTDPTALRGAVGPVILGAVDPDSGTPTIVIPEPDDISRTQMWIQRLGDTDLARAAGARLPLDIAGVEFTTDLAEGLSRARGRRLALGDIMEAARIHATQRLSRFATVVVPRHDWDDLIVPAATRRSLEDIVQRIEGRSALLSAPDAQPTGISALFAGTSGVGKSMAASVVAGRLGLPLWRVDLARVVSKYIGETEQNLEEVFEAAENAAAMLLFDEADALFGKRSEVQDAHDRYANLEISYLLQRTESFRGVVILSTNLMRHLDQAFARRLTFVVHFPFPEQAERELLWRAALPSRRTGIPIEALASHPLSGANIANAVQTARHLAHAEGTTLTAETLRRAIEHEFAKVGGSAPRPEVNP